MSKRSEKLAWVVFLLAALVLALGNAGCAVHNAPQISPQTAMELNVSSQLQQLERDYRTLFKDVGDAYRAGALTDAQVKELNEYGNKLKPLLEQANGLWKTYTRTYNEPIRVQVVALIQQAENIFLSLYAKKTQMMTGGAK